MKTLLALLIVLFAAGAAEAQDRLDALADAVDRAAAAPRGEAAIVEKMAAALSLTPERLRVARVETRLGWGDLFIAQRLATRGGHSLEKVAVARRTGTGWTEIAEEGRVDPAALAGDVAAAWPEIARAVAANPPPAAGPRVAPPSAPSATAPAPEPAPAETKEEPSRAKRITDFFRGRSSQPPERTPEQPQEDIRDRMLRGGGTRR
ncbi:MAG TPA: hypothetical protein VGT02_17545 [Methylomirabilota bacterium]|jgi:hypothetical protein|nr:hypothetical protein [Methylomirabilota bacterium]